MRIGYNQPATTFSISGTGAAFITDASALSNGRPADATRVQWISGSQTTSSVTVIIASFAQAFKAGIACLLMPNISTALPDGVKVTVEGKLSGSDVALGGNTTTTRTVKLASGATAAMWVFPPTLIDQFVVTIFNDRNGSTWATASQLFDLGEIFCGMAADFAIDLHADIELDGGIKQRQSHNNQAWPLLAQPYRVASVNIVPMSQTVAIGPNIYQDDFETVMNAIGTSSRCVLLLRYMLPGQGPAANGQPPGVLSSATIDAQQLARTFLLGVLDAPPKMTYNGDKYQIAPIKFGESPP